MDIFGILFLLTLHVIIKSKWLGIDPRALLAFAPSIIGVYLYLPGVYQEEGASEAIAFLFFVVLASTWVTGVQRRISSDINRPGQGSDN